ncbi:hypothetical protein PR202_gb00354 [Eleusine coracana subsp. coracana]|uniref:Histone deacetylase n=1 Tax=Eleusine coracana subsp. coracana TaxID=191504 RepID=A0AAV5DSE0_ELECO|nr:hypothetical protein PR202_gb00354 [Eleusine coracana subsp. coracana]
MLGEGPWEEGEGPDDMWLKMATCVRKVASEVFGVSREGKQEAKDTWWWNDEVQRAIKEECFKRLHFDKSAANIEGYKIAKRAAKRAVSVAKGQAYDNLYQRLGTKEGEKDIYQMARIRERKTRDINQIKCIKDGVDRLLVRDEEIKDRWREYFDKLFNGEEEGPILELDDSFDDNNRRFVRRIQEGEIEEALKRMKSGKAMSPDGIPVKNICHEQASGCPTLRIHQFKENQLTTTRMTHDAIRKGESFGLGGWGAYFLESNMFLERQAWMSHASFLHGSLLGCGIPSSLLPPAAAAAFARLLLARLLARLRQPVPVQEGAFEKRNRVPCIRAETYISGRMLPLLRHYCVVGSHFPFSWSSMLQAYGRKQNQIKTLSAQCSVNHDGASVSEKTNAPKKLTLPEKSLLDACILYCTSPALGHNKEEHPESNKRVPAIVDALEKLELSPKHRGSQVLEIQNFEPASLDDVARVHSRSYITGLEKVLVIKLLLFILFFLQEWGK